MSVTRKAILGGIGAVILFVLFFSFKTIPAGHRGILLRFGAVQDRILPEGLSFKIPFIDRVRKVTVNTQTISFDGDSSLAAASKDLQDVKIALVVNYHLDPEFVNSIYQQYGTTFTENVLEPIVRETVKSASAQFTAEELVTKRVEYSDAVSRLLSQRFTEKSVVFERSNVVNFSFSDSFNQAIEAKVTAEQNALAAKNKLEQVTRETEAMRWKTATQRNSNKSTAGCAMRERAWLRRRDSGRSFSRRIPETPT